MVTRTTFFYSFFAALVMVITVPATAAISYNLEQAHAVSGDTVRINAVVFNDTDTAMDWIPPEQLVLQWRDGSGRSTRSLAYLEAAPGQRNVPVNTFVRVSWSAVVPGGLTGLQAVNIEGEPTLLALDTSHTPGGRIVGSVAAGPVVDAGAAPTPLESDPALPETLVTAAGASPEAGPPVTNEARRTAPPLSPFDRFRNAISPYEPIYLVMGNKDGRNARYQVSFKYRLFSPVDPADTSFINHLYLGYTQTAVWDLHGDSYPFVDTSYKPGIFWRKDALFQNDNKQWFLGMAAGVQHESNGKGGDDSRSLNYAYLQPELNYRFNGGSTLTFAPRIKSYFHVSENNDYHRYAGNVDWQLRWAQDDGVVLTGLYRQGSKDRRMTQIDAAWPLRRTPLNMNGYLHLQYFNGYGETLLGYNHRSGPHFRIGLSLIP